MRRPLIELGCRVKLRVVEFDRSISTSNKNLILMCFRSCSAVGGGLSNIPVCYILAIACNTLIFLFMSLRSQIGFNKAVVNSLRGSWILPPGTH
jgi:hypothetical protein